VPKKKEKENAHRVCLFFIYVYIIIFIFIMMLASDLLTSATETRRTIETAQGTASDRRARCEACGLPATTTCSRCKRGRYCGRACFASLWPVHKAECRREVKLENVLPTLLDTLTDGESTLTLRTFYRGSTIIDGCR